MTPIFIRLTVDAEDWDVLVQPVMGNCEVWKGRVYLGQVDYHSEAGLLEIPFSMRQIAPQLLAALSMYKPLFAYEERLRGAQVPGQVAAS